MLVKHFRKLSWINCYPTPTPHSVSKLYEPGLARGYPVDARPMNPPSNQLESPERPASLSSGFQTPPHPTPDDPIPSSPSLASPSASYFGTMFTGLIRRFSTEDSQLGTQIDNFFMGPPQQSSNITSQSQGSQTTPEDDGINGVFQPPIKRTISPFRPPPLDPLVLHGYDEGPVDTARLLTSGIAEEIRTMVPERLRITENWKIIYSLEQDGASLSTLYQKCRDFEGQRVGFVIVVKDRDGGVSFEPTC